MRTPRCHVRPEYLRTHSLRSTYAARYTGNSRPGRPVADDMTDAIKIDVWSDIACPWCYIGKRNLENGLAAASADDDAPSVEVEFHSFELSPDTPVDFEGGEAEYLSSHKGISPAQAREMLDRVSGIAADAGLAYRFDLLKHTNTVKAHELLHFAKEQGRQLELAERLMSAYFTEGRHLGREDELVSLGGGCGSRRGCRARRAAERELPSGGARRPGAGDGVRHQRRAVLRHRREVRRLGRTAAEAFAQIVRQVWAEHREAVAAEV